MTNISKRRMKGYKYNKKLHEMGLNPTQTTKVCKERCKIIYIYNNVHGWDPTYEMDDLFIERGWIDERNKKER